MIKAIQTQYKGYFFRSRLEARWAVFFDDLGVRYQYEPEGFDLDESGYYLPDFYLPDINGGLWVEIKPVPPNDTEIDKLWALCKATGKQATFRVGEPAGNFLCLEDDHCFSDAYFYHDQCAVYKYRSECEEENPWDQDLPYLFCICPDCGRVGFEFDGRGARICGQQCYPHSDKEYSADNWRIVEAAKAARSARFEHGHRGASR